LGKPNNLEQIHQLDDELLRYSIEHSSPEDRVLAELRKRTWQSVLTPQMLCDPIQGKLLQNWSRMMQPKRVLELGTYTGYSAICLSAGLQSNGHIDTIEPNDELCTIQDEFWEKAGIREQITRHVGEAHEILRELKGPYDLIWIDADKPRTGDYVQMTMELVRPGGWILVDNVLWWGKVLPSHASPDSTSKLLQELCVTLSQDQSVRSTLLPIRDGILMIQKV